MNVKSGFYGGILKITIYFMRKKLKNKKVISNVKKLITLTKEPHD